VSKLSLEGWTDSPADNFRFVVAFSLPYLLYAPYANLGMKVGFIFAPIATLATIWAYFFLPECKGLRRVSVPAGFALR
jgi:hypothetical protein